MLKVRFISVFMTLMAFLTLIPLAFADVDDNQTTLDFERVMSISDDIFKIFIPEPSVDQATALENLLDSFVQLARGPASDYWTKAFVLNLAITGHLMIPTIGMEQTIDFFGEYLKLAASILPLKMHQMAHHFASTSLQELREEFVRFEKDIKLISRTSFAKIPVPPETAKMRRLAGGGALILAGVGTALVASYGIPIFDLMSPPQGFLGPLIGGFGSTLVYLGMTRIYKLSSTNGQEALPDETLELMKAMFPASMSSACQKFLTTQPMIVKIADE